jgi:hypothetical protein
MTKLNRGFFAAWFFAASIFGLVAEFSVADALADERTPIFGWNSEEFSLYPLIYVGKGGFGLPGIRRTEETFSVPFVHYESQPKTRFDLTPVYHYTEGDDGFALGPRRRTINEGLHGVAGWIFDLTTLLTNTRQYIADDTEGYERYREYGHSEMLIPGYEEEVKEGVALEKMVRPAPPAPPPSEFETPTEQELESGEPASTESNADTVSGEAPAAEVGAGNAPPQGGAQPASPPTGM